LADALEKSFDFRFSESEQYALLTAMDVNSESFVHLPQLTCFIRPSPSPRRLVY